VRTEIAPNILTVDDDPHVLRSLRAALESHGYRVRAATSGAIALEACTAERPDVVLLDLALPGMDGVEVCRRLRDWSRVPILVLSARVHEQQKVQALDAGAEIIVAQGTEAGGHGGSRGTLPLVPALVDLMARRAPQAMVVAAGGIADGRGLAAALALGAEGVLVGTRFYATVESLGHDKAKARILATSGDATVRTTVFDTVRGYRWPDGITGRALRNDFTARWHSREPELAAELEDEKLRYQAAAARGDVDTVVVFAGECTDLIDDVPPAGEIVARLVREAERALAVATGCVV